MKIKNLLPLIFIIVIAAILRFNALDKFPVSPNWDEVSHGYNAYSILKTGKDEWGTVLPTIFRAFGDYKLPVYIYLTIIPVFLFGLNVFAVRFISALAGTLAIPGIYLLANSLFPDEKFKITKMEINIGHVSALILALMPWHVFISRPALEANLSLTLIIYGFYFLYRGFKKPSSFLSAALLLGLSLHTYNTARVFVPTLTIVFLLLFRRQIKFTRTVIFSATLFLLSITLVVYQVFSGTAIARYNKLKILSENAVFQIGQDRTDSLLPKPLPTLLHNRPLYFSLTVAKNYLGYFSPQFLYQWKGAQSQFAIPIKNLFSLPTTILVLMGLIGLLHNKNKKAVLFLIGWLLLSPLAASLTADPPQTLRPNPFIPPVAILAAIGIFFLLDKVRPILKIAILVSVVLSLSISISRYMGTYYGEYAHYYSDSWQYGYKEAFDYLKTVDGQYDKVIFTKVYAEPHIFYAFYNQLNPKILQPGGDNIRFEKSDWFWTDKVGKYFFVNDWNIPYRGEIMEKAKLESGEEIDTHRSLLVTTFNRLPDNAKVEKIIEFIDGRVAFIIASIP